MKLVATDWRLAVCKLAERGMPDWAAGSAFVTFSRTPDEVSLVCEERVLPEGVAAETGWRCLRVAGTLDFALVGILARLTAPLAEAGISLFVVSTHDTDYVLVKAGRYEAAIAALAAAGHEIVAAEA